MKSVFTIFGAVFVLIIGSCSALAVGGAVMMKGVSEPAHAFLEGVRTQNRAQVNATLAPEFKKTTSEADVIKFIRDMRLQRNTSAEFNKVNFKNGHGRVEGTIVLDDTTQYDAVFTMVKVNDEWKISGVNVTTSKASAA